MASGLMTLAYLGEMGLVLNLAYAELAKGRYLEGAQDELKRLKTLLDGDPRNVAPTNGYTEFAALLERAKKMFSDDAEVRCQAWHYDGANGLAHNDHYAKTIYQRFLEEKDRWWADKGVVAASIALILITILDRLLATPPFAFFSPAPSWVEPLVWWLVFGLLLWVNGIPLCWVIRGRKLKDLAQRVVKNAKVELGRIASNQINAATNKVGNVGPIP